MKPHLLTRIAFLLGFTAALGAEEQPKAQPGTRGTDSGDSYYRFAHPTIRDPFVDLGGVEFAQVEDLALDDAVMADAQAFAERVANVLGRIHGYAARMHEGVLQFGALV